ncbi:Fe-S protein assembly co-chaperone HscB [Emericellopsis atlantica]|uniref:Fe-S protein assembly co-chaperone HscB n=1 Tax=Emericellopsis atlantica TaxID=2614577 RepID=A0A9P8CJZ5_9HYPO|nr:Fe-S protein assembly co-chaperone HscB [Emericellopsis atlantica]KAG9249838.1 Fe-S protein assembly co-chaperone HscB [Emericellopsis atlantica]
MRPTATRIAGRVCTRCHSAPRASILPAVTAATSRACSPRPALTGAAFAFAFSTTPHSLSSEAPQRSQSPSAQQQPTHYSLFPQTLPDGPPPAGRFPIPLRTLRKEFLSLQAKHHPDLHPPATRPQAEQISSVINEAYRTLANPLYRAQYLLGLRGVDVANDETLKTENQELLMEVLEARESIEEAEAEDDLVDLRTENEERIRNSEEELDRAFGSDDIQAAKEEAVRLRYWVNIQDSLDNWEQGKPVVLEH